MAQPSSGTFLFAPSVADLVLESFSRLQIRPASLTAQHMRDAYMSGNFLQVEWSVKQGPNLWSVELLSFALTQGQSTVSIPENVVDVLDVYLNSPTGSTFATDIVMFPISRTEYADQPNKLQQARPTTFWWNRQINSTIYLWPVPDQNGPYTLNCYIQTQIQDANLPQGATPNVPYRFLDAFAAGLAAKLAVKYSPPQIAVGMVTMAEQAWELASQQDSERAPIYIIPGLDSYFR